MTASVMRFESPFSELVAVLTVCDFLYRMALPKETSRMMVEAQEAVTARMTETMLFGERPLAV